MNRDELLALRGFRYRTKTRLFRKPLVVLQVEDTRSHTDPITIETRVWGIWRDATPDDLIRALAAQTPSGGMTGE
jgi:hypothetical protein